MTTQMRTAHDAAHLQDLARFTCVDPAKAVGYNQHDFGPCFRCMRCGAPDVHGVRMQQESDALRTEAVAHWKRKTHGPVTCSVCNTERTVFRSVAMDDALSPGLIHRTVCATATP